MAGEVEAGIWERVAAEMAGAQAHLAGGGLVRAFITDLGRFVDGRKVGWVYCSPGARSCHNRLFSEWCESLLGGKL